MRKLELERGEQESEEVENSALIEKQQKFAAKNRQGKKRGRGEHDSVTKKRKSQGGMFRMVIVTEHGAMSDAAANEGEMPAE
ncbi:hypothetical protein GBAR_LOCUS29328, partial [Geodia barretti]